ncbi:hypothetical protein DMUE_2061 [Dictyocoela muelleri]|nr:hypothetical protein DMUE_2061 [Dictyocoela muelleri]
MLFYFTLILTSTNPHNKTTTEPIHKKTQFLNHKHEDKKPLLLPEINESDDKITEKGKELEQNKIQKNEDNGSEHKKKRNEFKFSKKQLNGTFETKDMLNDFKTNDNSSSKLEFYNETENPKKIHDLKQQKNHEDDFKIGDLKGTEKLIPETINNPLKENKNLIENQNSGKGNINFIYENPSSDNKSLSSSHSQKNEILNYQPLYNERKFIEPFNLPRINEFTNDDNLNHQWVTINKEETFEVMKDKEKTDENIDSTQIKTFFSKATQFFEKFPKNMKKQKIFKIFKNFKNFNFNENSQKKKYSENFENQENIKNPDFDDKIISLKQKNKKKKIFEFLNTKIVKTQEEYHFANSSNSIKIDIMNCKISNDQDNLRNSNAPKNKNTHINNSQESPNTPSSSYGKTDGLSNSFGKTKNFKNIRNVKVIFHENPQVNKLKHEGETEEIIYFSDSNSIDENLNNLGNSINENMINLGKSITESVSNLGKSINETMNNLGKSIITNSRKIKLNRPNNSININHSNRSIHITGSVIGSGNIVNNSLFMKNRGNSRINISQSSRSNRSVHVTNSVIGFGNIVNNSVNMSNQANSGFNINQSIFGFGNIMNNSINMFNNSNSGVNGNRSVRINQSIFGRRGVNQSINFGQSFFDW